MHQYMEKFERYVEVIKKKKEVLYMVNISQ